MWSRRWWLAAVVIALVGAGLTYWIVRPESRGPLVDASFANLSFGQIVTPGMLDTMALDTVRNTGSAAVVVEDVVVLRARGYTTLPARTVTIWTHDASSFGAVWNRATGPTGVGRRLPWFQFRNPDGAVIAPGQSATVVLLVAQDRLGRFGAGALRIRYEAGGRQYVLTMLPTIAVCVRRTLGGALRHPCSEIPQRDAPRGAAI